MIAPILIPDNPITAPALWGVGGGILARRSSSVRTRAPIRAVMATPCALRGRSGAPARARRGGGSGELGEGRFGGRRSADRVRVAMPERRETVLRTVRSRRRSWCDGPLRVARTVPCPEVVDHLAESASSGERPAQGGVLASSGERPARGEWGSAPGAPWTPTSRRSPSAPCAHRGQRSAASILHGSVWRWTTALGIAHDLDGFR